MSDTRSLTNPRLHICGRIEDNTNTASPSSSSSSSSLCGWLCQILSQLRCRGRRKEWRTNDGSTTPVSETMIVKDDSGEDEYEQTDESPETDHFEDLVVKELHKPKLKNTITDLNFHWLVSNSVSDTFKLLLVFPRDNDQQSEIIASVARKLGWRVSEAKNAEETMDKVRSQSPDLAIVDRRGSLRSQDADEICRVLNGRANKKCCSIIALVKRSFFTAPHVEEAVILDLLNIGYSRALMECSHEEILMNELIGIHAGESRPKSQLAAAQILYLAVERCRDMVHVTNEEYIIQFANKTSEKLLGYKVEDLVGRSIENFTTNAIFAVMDQQLQKGREFEGNLSWKRKKKGLLTLSCRIIPVNLPACKETHYLYLYDSSSNEELISLHSSTHYYSARGSVSSLGRLHSPDRQSSSSKPRRSTIAKLHNLPLEAPITKIITILVSAAHDSDSPEVAAQIGQAIELMKSTKLYSPNLKDTLLSQSNPVAADLLEALIDIPSNEPRKASGISLEKSSTILKMLGSEYHKNVTDIAKTISDIPDLEELLDTCFDWNFDIFKLETLTNRRPLYFLGMTIMDRYQVAERLGCDERVLQNWLTIVEKNYNWDISYHNSTHATDVLQGVARYLRSPRLQGILDPLDEVASLIAAAAHDIGHPGKSSQFLCNSSNKLAILYNDLTVLESHHAALTFKLTLSDDNVNIFKNLDRDVYHLMRHNIIDMILATEMTKHFEHLTKFVNVCSRRMSDNNSEVFDMDVADTSVLLLPENVTMTKRMMIKCADVSNPTRPFRLYLEWTRRIAEEYFHQTDEEKRRNMPVVMPMFDRSSCSIPKSQIGFVDFIINDMMEAWDAFIDLPEMIENMKENYERWKEFNEMGIMTIEDIIRLQKTPELKLYTKKEIQSQSLYA